MKPGNLLHITSLGSGWCDKNIVMLHACFQLLSDCIEVEKLFESDIDWDFDDRHRFEKAELLALYNWWKARLKSEDFYADTEAQLQEDDVMLARLIRVRSALWV